MRVLLCLLCLSACATTLEHNARDPAIVEIGSLQNSKINEASGLAQSLRQDDRLWTLNDSGDSATLYAFAEDGSDHGSVILHGAVNDDWEDLASFKFSGRPFLLIADVGDNFSNRDKVSLYIVEEPDPMTGEVTPSWQIDFNYPDGPKDAEAVAVDESSHVAYVLSKRTIPARLYSIPLTPDSVGENTLATANYLGTIDSLPQPTEDDLDQALARKSWHWQPTAMDFSPDGKSAVILTYRAVYLYQRQGGESWIDALQRSPVTYDLGDIKEAEAVSLGDGKIFITVEAPGAPIYRIDIGPQQ
jgi:hypothetical protein